MRNFKICEKYYEQYGEFFEKNRMLGPNALWLIEILCEKMDLKPGMRVLDMGCGKGLTSIFLAKEFGVIVFANDLWVDPTDNYERFVEMKVDDKVFSIHGEAIEGGKEIWRATADYDLHDADTESYLTLVAMTVIKR